VDISKVNYRAHSEIAHFCHFTDPATGELMVEEGVALGAMVLGASAKSVQSALISRSRADLQSKPDVSTDAGLEKHQKALIGDASLVTTKIVGFTKDGKEIPADGFAEFYDLTFFDVDVMLGRKGKKFGSFAQQVWIFSNEQANFLPKA
jgi:hypothetical protein